MRLFHNKLIIDNCAAFNYGPSIELPENNYSSCAECERVENWLQQVDLNADMIASMDNSNIDYDKTGAADCLCAEYDDLSYSVSMQEFNMSGVVTDNSSLVQNVPECVPYSLTSESDSERQRYISGHDYVSILVKPPILREVKSRKSVMFLLLDHTTISYFFFSITSKLKR